tara:strand:+ start:322 stop:465 length:144 start_codon:yes stop_codon:yes gene_type:complete
MEFLTLVIMLSTIFAGAVYTHLDYKEDCYNKHKEYTEQQKKEISETR